MSVVLHVTFTPIGSRGSTPAPAAHPTAVGDRDCHTRDMKRAPAVVGIILVCTFLIVHDSLPRMDVTIVTPSFGSLVEGTPSSTRIDPHVLPASAGLANSGAIAAATASAPAAAAAVPPQVELVPPPPPSPLCTELSCTRKLRSLEPAWAKLAFQPRINWQAGGIRGDCVVGEIEYIEHKYCEPTSTIRKHDPRISLWPSEERLEAADVYSQPLPKATLTDLANMLPNQTLLIMGDSVMEQFYNALQCMLRKEELEEPPDDAFLNFIKKNEYLWKMGKRKMPPKLPQKARTGMKMLFSRQVNYQPEDVAASLQTGDVIVVNWGLHYDDMNKYKKELHEAFAQFEQHATRTGNAVLFRETGAQHFKEADERGVGMLRSSTGEWEKRDKSTDKNCACSPVEDFNVNKQNRALHEVLGTGKYPHVKLLPFADLTRPRWRWHFGNCTHRPNGWNWDTCCDCTHFCFSPGMWKAHLFDLKNNLQVA